MRCTLSTKFSRAALVQTFGWTASTYASPSMRSPASGRLEKRLELPALRPAVVVRQVRVEAADEGALLALGAQIRVDLPQRRLDLHSEMPRIVCTASRVAMSMTRLSPTSPTSSSVPPPTKITSTSLT
jgi:hypothetical protein